MKMNLLMMFFSFLIVIFTYFFNKSDGIIASGGYAKDQITYSKDMMGFGDDADIGPFIGFVFLPLLLIFALPNIKTKIKVVLFGTGWLTAIMIFIFFDLYGDTTDIHATIFYDNNYALLGWIISVFISFPIVMLMYLKFHKIQTSKEFSDL
jgi:hypothetical protein